MKKITYLVVAIIIIVAIVWLAGSKKTTVMPQNVVTNSSVTASSSAPVTAINVNYYKNITGYYARPTAEGVYPGVVMMHEWWGLNDNIRDMARKLAAEGYQVLAVDLYGVPAATTTERAMALVAGVNPAESTANMRAAAAYLRSKGVTAMASLGWCFGGGKSLELALSGEKLDATVIYYGTPLSTSTQQLSAIKWPVLGIFGGADTAVPTTTVEAFHSALNSLGVVNEINIYPGVGHAFANPSGMNYAPAETADAWAKTLRFLAANTRK